MCIPGITHANKAIYTEKQITGTQIKKRPVKKINAVKKYSFGYIHAVWDIYIKAADVVSMMKCGLMKYEPYKVINKNLVKTLQYVLLLGYVVGNWLVEQVGMRIPAEKSCGLVKQIVEDCKYVGLPSTAATWPSKGILVDATTSPNWWLTSL